MSLVGKGVVAVTLENVNVPANFGMLVEFFEVNTPLITTWSKPSVSAN